MPRPLPADTWQNLFYPPPDYLYFDGAGEFGFEPEAPGFSWRNAWWLAESALLAYVKQKPWNDIVTILKGAGFDDAIEIGADPTISTRGFIAWRSGASPFAVTAYRGTDKDDERNLCTDADTVPESRDGYMAHRGFLEALDQVWATEVTPALTTFLGRNPGAPVYFTGHSLGAALATISVARFGGPVGALYTIGSPRVGDHDFGKAVLQKTARVFRFVNSEDIVTQIPPAVFVHVGDERYINRTGSIADNPAEFDKWIDAMTGIAIHDGIGCLHEIANPSTFISLAEPRGALPDPPPYLLGNHTPARYSIRIWNYYSGR